MRLCAVERKTSIETAKQSHTSTWSRIRFSSSSLSVVWTNRWMSACLCASVCGCGGWYLAVRQWWTGSQRHKLSALNSYRYRDDRRHTDSPSSIHLQFCSMSWSLLKTFSNSYSRKASVSMIHHCTFPTLTNKPSGSSHLVLPFQKCSIAFSSKQDFFSSHGLQHENVNIVQ